MIPWALHLAVYLQLLPLSHVEYAGVAEPTTSMSFLSFSFHLLYNLLFFFLIFTIGGCNS